MMKSCAHTRTECVRLQRRAASAERRLLLGVVCCGVLAVVLCCVSAQAGQRKPAPGRWWPASVETALAHAGSNRSALEEALTRVPKNRREGMAFLIVNMPPEDLRRLSASFLLDDVAQAYDAFEQSVWKSKVPKEIFLNAVLPYASLNEQREAWRKNLREKSAPLVADCRTPGEAAHRLNQKLFPLLNVRYSTARKRPDQAPLETMATGIATCSGLSILLVDACRSVGIPARVVGTPLWSNMRGNHTWVEIWDGHWHFAGAAEPDGAGLDHGWFTHDASEAKKDVPEHAIYASSYKRTGISFPLVWAEEIKWVPAENVTDRYTPRTASSDSSKARVLIKVSGVDGKRVAAQVTVREVGKDAVLFRGTSRGETADLNDMLTFEAFRVCPAPEYEASVETFGKIVRQRFHAGASAQEIVEIRLN